MIKLLVVLKESWIGLVFTLILAILLIIIGVIDSKMNENLEEE